jgi:ADP-L-glycero-D-manno-heptose 6-epimerase
MILVTGAAGFIGSNLVAALVASGEHEIIACDHFGDADKWQNIAKYELADVIDPEDIFYFLDEHDGGVDAIFHMGAISSTTETDVDLIIRNNFKLSLNLWNSCAAHQVPFIYASSAATYGDRTKGFDDDGSCDALAQLQPMNAYGWSKHLFDRRVARMVADGAKTPPQWAGLKFFNVYGPNEYHKGNQQSVVPQIFKQIRETGRATLFESHNLNYEDGGQLRDFIWVGDCIDVMIWLCENRNISGLFNCGTGKARSFKDLAKAVFAALDKKPEITYIPTPENIRNKYQYFTEANMDRLYAAGYSGCTTSLEDGVKRYVQDFLLAPDPYG